MNLVGYTPERFIAFECLVTVVKHTEKVVKMASRANEQMNKKQCTLCEVC